MFGILSQGIRDARKARNNKRHLPPPKSFIPRLEELEKREMLAADVAESAAAFLNDATRFRNDMETSPLALVNAVPPSSSPATVANQWNKIENDLAANWGRMQQAFVRFEFAVLTAYQQEFDALLADWSRLLSPQTPPPSPFASASSSGAGSGQPSAGNPSGGIHPLSGSVHDPLYVLDMNTGETVPANAKLNTFSTWSENLLAQVSGATVSSYSWNVSQAPDLTNVSGTTTANLQGTWSSFTGAARTDTISVTETPQFGQPLTQTMTFVVAGTDSPAYSSSRPTSSSTWPTVITPDQMTSNQETVPAGSYASLGLADGAVQTSFSMPSYNPNTAPVSLDYNSTTANAQPIFLDEYQLPLGQSVPSTISAQLTFNGTALSTVTYNTSGLNPGDIVQVALQANATGLSTGRYPWSITVTNGSTPTTSNGNVDIVNQAASPFGAGWSLDNVEQLFPVTGGAILVNPTGTSLWFASNGQGGFTTPAGDFSTLTLSSGVYTRTMPDGTKIHFNSSGQETSSVDRDGNTTTFGYTSGQLTTITDMNGQVTTLTYSSGLLSSITDPANRTATLTYTGKQLTSITDPDSDLWQYTYNSVNDLTTLTDPNDHTTSFTYNSADRASSITLADTSTEHLTAMQMNGWAAAGSSNVTAVLLAAGDTAQFTDGRSNVWKTGFDWLGFGLPVLNADPLGDTSLIYRDPNGLPWMMSDPLARRTRAFFNSQGDPTEVVQPDDSYAQYQYNSFGEVTKYTDPTGAVTTNTYNSKGDLTQMEDALLHTWTYTYNSQGLLTSQEDPLLHTTTYGYNTLNELTTLTNALNLSTSYAYSTAGQLISTTDPLGYTATSSYDAMNRLTGKTLPDSSTTNSVYTYTYDKVGNQTSVTDALNNTTTYSYNAVNERTAVTNALNQTTTYGYDADGNQISVTNPLSQTTTNTYNAANELANITNALNNTYTYTYDAAGEKTSATNPLNQTTNYKYTLLGQLASVTDPLGDALDYTYNAVGDNTNIIQAGLSNPTLTTTLGYNAVHEQTSSTNPLGNTTGSQYDADGNLISQTDPLGHTTTYSYNALNQLVSETNALNQTTTYTYDAVGNQISATNPLNQTTSYTYDAQGRELTATAPNGGVTKYTYDKNGNLLSLTDPDNNTTTYSYNAVNEQIGSTNPMGHPATNTYNAAGEMTSTTDADGRTIDYSYDAIGEKTGETWVGGNYTATYQYNSAGELTNASDPYSTYAYTYDAAGRETSVSNAGTPGVPSVTLTYGYDAYGDRTGLSDSVGLGGGVSYSYNGQLQLTGLKMFSGISHTLAGQLTLNYDVAGRLTDMTRTGGAFGSDTLTSSYSYDNANELTNIAHTDTTKALTLANYTYGYNSGGELTNYQDNNSSSLTYGYDANGELTSASGTLNGSTYSVSYSYDENGNRTMSGYTTGTGNELTSDGIYNYTYDNDGNMTSQTNISTGYVTYYSWDYRNRLIEVKQEDNHSNVLNDEKFTYDVNNNRIAVSLNGTPQLYTVYDGANPYMDFNDSGTLTQRYLYNPNGLNQLYGQVSASGTSQWFLTDNINSIRQVVNTTGTSLDVITYDPYGKIVSQSNSVNAPRFLYAGGAYDAITGTYQDREREDNPADGRWLNQDPLGFLAGDANLYRYTYNAPTTLADPSGEFGTLITGAIGAGVGAVVGGISSGFMNGWTWQNVGKGAAVGAVAGGVTGLTLGLAGPGIASAVGGGWFGSGVAGATAGVAGNVAGQGFAIGMGWQNGFSGVQVIFSGGIGFVFGAGGSLLTKLFMRPTYNLGGEGEVPGAINVQPPGAPPPPEPSIIVPSDELVVPTGPIQPGSGNIVSGSAPIAPQSGMATLGPPYQPGQIVSIVKGGGSATITQPPPIGSQAGVVTAGQQAVIDAAPVGSTITVTATTDGMTVVTIITPQGVTRQIVGSISTIGSAAGSGGSSGTQQK